MPFCSKSRSIKDPETVLDGAMEHRWKRVISVIYTFFSGYSQEEHEFLRSEQNEGLAATAMAAVS